MSSVAGKTDSSCEKCGHPYAMPARPIEDPAGGGPGRSGAATTAEGQAKYNSAAGIGGGDGKIASSASKMPGKPTAATGTGTNKSPEKGAKTATLKPEDPIWQPSATWEMTAEDDRADEDY
jgi:hypothetical protein